MIEIRLIVAFYFLYFHIQWNGKLLSWYITHRQLHDGFRMFITLYENTDYDVPLLFYPGNFLDVQMDYMKFKVGDLTDQYFFQEPLNN